MNMKFLHAPLHAPSTRGHASEVARRIRALDADSTGMTEAYVIEPDLHSIPGFRLVMEGGGHDRRRGQHDVPILVKSNLESRGSGQLYGSDSALPFKIAPERWNTFSSVKTARWGTVTHIALHPHAAIQDANGEPLSNGRVRKYVEQMRVFDLMLNFFTLLGDEIVVTGDMNYKDVGPLWEHSPYAIMRRHGMHMVSSHIDAVGWTKNLRLSISHVTGVRTDHPWLLGETS